MNKSINVQTGEVKIANKHHSLVSNAIGSCIVVTMYDTEKQIGGAAHIMLPGKAPKANHPNGTRYAENAIEKLIELMEMKPEDHKKIQISMVGGGNVLKKTDYSICTNNINSVKEIMKSNNFSIAAESLGGTQRRTLRFDVEKKEVFFTIDNSEEMLLWKSNGDI